MLSFRVFVVFNKSSYLYWKLQILDVCMLSIFPAPTKRFLLLELSNACQKKKIILRNAIFETSFLKIAECLNFHLFTCSIQTVLATLGISEGCQPCRPSIDHTDAL